MAVSIWFQFIATSTLSFNTLLTRESLYLQQDAGQDRRPLFPERVLNEVYVYILEAIRKINSLTELAWAGQGFINESLGLPIVSKVEDISHDIDTTI